jgi:hypothetical protein
LARTLASPYLGHEPNVRVATITKGVEAEKVIKKVKSLQYEYNELNCGYLKTHHDFKVL